MEVENCDLNKICRVCLETSTILVHISTDFFVDESTNGSVKSAFQDFSGYFIERESFLFVLDFMGL